MVLITADNRTQKPRPSTISIQTPGQGGKTGLVFLDSIYKLFKCCFMKVNQEFLFFSHFLLLYFGDLMFSLLEYLRHRA